MAQANQPLGPRPILTLGVAALLYAISLILIDIAPFFIGLYVDHLGFSLAQAGLVQTIDQAGGVLGAIAGFFLMPRTSWRNLIAFAALIATAANALTGMVDDYGLLLAVRFLSGFGVVLITTVSACILARAAIPDRAFGVGLALGMALSALAIWILDWLRLDYGNSFGLASGAVWLGVGVLLALLLPGELGGHADAADLSIEAEHETGSLQVGRSALISLGLFGISVNVVYGFLERVGLANGLDNTGVASALALGYVFATFGSLIPSIFGAAGGRLKWIVGTTVVFVASLFALYSANTVALYTAAYAVYASVWNMGLAYYMSLTAENDPQERYTRGMYIVNVAAQSLGPAIAAAILIGAPLATIFVVAPLPAILAAMLVMWTVARQGGQEVSRTLDPIG